jgi:acyl-CoA synthetase (AMP-forming)/AMP-acid ligase II
MVVAAIQPKDTADPPDVPSLFEYCRGVGLMTQKIPERVMIIEVMPRNPSGKVPKHELRKQLLGE